MMNLKESFMAKNTKIYDEYEGILGLLEQTICHI